MTTSKELVMQAIDRQEVDRVPFCPPFQGFWALGYAGVRTQEFLDNPELAASAQVKATEECGFDSVEVLWDWLFPVEALGCEVKIPEFGTIGTQSHVVKEPGDVDRLELPDLDSLPRSAADLRTAELVVDRLGKDHFTTASLPGPFTIAGEVRGVENMLYDSLVDEDFVVSLLKRTTEIAKELVERVSQIGVDAIMIADPTTSGDMISSEDFDRFSKRQLTEVGRVVEKHGKVYIIHMCGDTSDRLVQIAETGCRAFSCDRVVDIGKAKEAVGDRMAIIGNVDPSGMLFMGTPEEVEESCMDLLRAGGKKGYLLGAGCDIPVGCRVENIKAMRAAVDRF